MLANLLLTTKSIQTSYLDDQFAEDDKWGQFVEFDFEDQSPDRWGQYEDFNIEEQKPDTIDKINKMLAKKFQNGDKKKKMKLRWN